MVVLSPHRDDAAFSCGLLLSLCAGRGVPVRIVNVFTRSEYAPYLALDPATEPLDIVSAARREEDLALLRCLGPACSMDDLDLLDAPVRLGLTVERVLSDPLSSAEVAKAAEALARNLSMGAGADATALVFAPLALGDHVDHRIVREAACKAFPCERLAFYEDLPYAARLPGDAPGAAVRDLLHGSDLTQPIVVAAPDGNNGALKRELAMLYPSQIEQGVADEMASYADRVGGERFYACAEHWPHMEGVLRGKNI